MGTKLRLILRKIHWSLLVKSVVLGGSWIAAPFLFFEAVAFYFYFQSGPRRFQLWFSFIVLSALCWFGKLWLGGYWLLIFGMIFAAAWFFLIGIKGLFFLHRQRAYLLLSAALFSASSLFFFWQARITEFFPATPLFLIGLALIFWEFYAYLAAEKRVSIRVFLAAASLLVFFELSWAMILLPVGFLSATAFLLIAFSVFQHSFFDYHSGVLDRKRILVNGTIFVAGVLIIFIFSSWRL